MKKYQVTFYATGSKDIVVIADNEQDAIEKARAGRGEILYVGIDGDSDWELGDVNEV
jgi:hypothetical protein